MGSITLGREIQSYIPNVCHPGKRQSHFQTGSDVFLPLSPVLGIEPRPLYRYSSTKPTVLSSQPVV